MNTNTKYMFTAPGEHAYMSIISVTQSINIFMSIINVHIHEHSTISNSVFLIGN
jgi:hypothetical protein